MSLLVSSAHKIRMNKGLCGVSSPGVTQSPLKTSNLSKGPKSHNFLLWEVSRATLRMKGGHWPVGIAGLCVLCEPGSVSYSTYACQVLLVPAAISNCANSCVKELMVQSF